MLHLQRRKKRCFFVLVEPLGSQVPLMESLRFLLLKAVMIPITKNIRGRSFDWSATAFETAGDPSDLAAARAVASSTSRDDIVLSNVLYMKCIIISWSFCIHKTCYRLPDKKKAVYLITSWVWETRDRMSPSWTEESFTKMRLLSLKNLRLCNCDLPCSGNQQEDEVM